MPTRDKVLAAAATLRMQANVIEECCDNAEIAEALAQIDDALLPLRRLK